MENSPVRRTATWLFGTLAAATLAFSAGPQEARLPEGPGKDLAEMLCTYCHGADRIVDQRLDREGWDSVISAMMSEGAEVTDDEFSILLDYLVKNLGPNSPAPQQEASSASNEGKKILEAACTTCHDLALVQNKNLDRQGWETVIDSMKSKGAEMTGAETSALLDYLVKTYGQ